MDPHPSALTADIGASSDRAGALSSRSQLGNAEEPRGQRKPARGQLRPRHLLLQPLGPPAHGRGCAGEQGGPPSRPSPPLAYCSRLKGFRRVGGAAWLTAVRSADCRAGPTLLGKAWRWGHWCCPLECRFLGPGPQCDSAALGTAPWANPPVATPPPSQGQ